MRRFLQILPARCGRHRCSICHFEVLTDARDRFIVITHDCCEQTQRRERTTWVRAELLYGQKIRSSDEILNVRRTNHACAMLNLDKMGKLEQSKKNMASFHRFF